VTTHEVHGTDEHHVATARDFLSRVQAPPLTRSVWLGEGLPDDLEDLRLADWDGVPLAESPHVHRAIRRNTGLVGVALADGRGRVFSTGQVAARRSVAGTVAAAARVAGPLALLAREPAHSPTRPASTPMHRLVTNAAGAAWFAGRLARAAGTYREWACAPVQTLDPGLANLQTRGSWQSGATHFWADPCVVDSPTGVWVFVEELDRRIGRGHILAVPVCEGRLAAEQAVCVLSNDHHLSFPQVTFVAGRWLATVETCARFNPVYTFEDPGHPWRPVADLPALPPHTGDPVVDFATGVLIGTDARTDPDSVLMQYRIAGTQWEPLVSAVRVDTVWSRGAGTWDRTRGWRAVQDCSGTYGRAVGLVATDPMQAPLARWAAQQVTGRRWRGVHTLTWTPPMDQIWIDAWRRRISPLGWRRRLIERSHLQNCQG
jgi:hypothetical protein